MNGLAIFLYENVWVLGLAVFIAAGIAAAFYDQAKDALTKGRRLAEREQSLRQEPDGSFTWIGLDGIPRSSPRDPRAEGGAWQRDTNDGA